MSEKKPKEKKEKKPGNPMLPLIIIMVILLIMMIAGFGYLIMNQKKPEVKTVTVVQTNTVELPPLSHPLTEFLVNLGDTDTKRYLKITMSLAFSSKKLDTELTEMDSAVRDSINSILRGKVAADFTAKGTEDLKKQIMDRLNTFLKDGKISDVYFTSVLVQ